MNQWTDQGFIVVATLVKDKKTVKILGHKRLYEVFYTKIEQQDQYQHEALRLCCESVKRQEKNNLDIIAMGAYGHNRFRSTIFGSFTTKMLLNSKTIIIV